MRALALALLMAAPAARAQGLDARLADLRLATAVRLALAEDPATARLAAAVHARGGAVALDADWPSAEVQARAGAVARGVRGVSSVAFGDAAPPPTAALDVGAGGPLDGEAEEETTEAAPAAPAPHPAAPRARNVEPAPRAAEPVAPAPTPEPAPAPERPPADAGAVYHTVRLGDTLYSIARRYATSVEAIQALNGLGGAIGLTLGQRLRVR